LADKLDNRSSNGFHCWFH